MSSMNTTTPTHSTEPTAHDYAVPDPQEAWNKMGRLVSRVVGTPKDSDKGNTEQKVSKKKAQ